MNEQARDRYGRPLRGSFESAVPGVAPREWISSAQAWDEALDYLDHDLPFHAHEVLEQRWRCCPHEERAAWQALAQWAAAITHSARGTRTGALSIARSTLERLDSVSVVPLEVDVDRVRTSLTGLLS